MNKKEIGARLVKLRGKRTQREIADKLEIAQSTYAMYELGERIPSDEIKLKIADLYKKSVQYIFFN